MTMIEIHSEFVTFYIFRTSEQTNHIRKLDDNWSSSITSMKKNFLFDFFGSCKRRIRKKTFYRLSIIQYLFEGMKKNTTPQTLSRIKCNDKDE